MRLWSLHPKYLDSKGLVALWREGLLAQNVLAGKTKGYINHPQLNRFKNTKNPEGAISSYLRFVYLEAESRGYKFDRNKIINRRFQKKIEVTKGQVAYELQHLLGKLNKRDHELYKILKKSKGVEVHPLLNEVDGDIEPWEVI